LQERTSVRPFHLWRPPEFIPSNAEGGGGFLFHSPPAPSFRLA
jgi:hypothetical protein